jgi:tetratricopeptide (TPR) repeat protein/CHAT domain-containing protein
VSFWKSLFGNKDEDEDKEEKQSNKPAKQLSGLRQLFLQTERLIEQGQLEQALATASQARHLALRHLGEEHEDYAVSLRTLAEVYRAKGDSKRADLLLEQAMEVLRKTQGDHPSFASIGSNEQGKAANQLPPAAKLLSESQLLELQQLEEQSSSLLKQGYLDQALDYALRRCDLTRKYLGENHPKYAASLRSLAHVYKTMGDYSRAEDLYKQALEIYRRSLGERDPNTASVLDDLGIVYRAVGNYSRAEDLYKQALEIRRSSLGEDHLEYAASLNNLGVLYFARGNYAGAKPLLERALEVYRGALGEDHPDVIRMMPNIAALCVRMGDYSRAEVLYKRALEIGRRVFGQKHYHIAVFENNLAELYETMGDYSRAEVLYKRALEIGRKALGKKHPLIATFLDNLADVYKTMGDYSRAEVLYKQALEIYRRSPGEKSPDFAVILNDLAGLYQRMGAYRQAEKLYERALEIRREFPAEDQLKYAESLRDLAVHYREMGKYSRAKPLFEHALEIYRGFLDEDQPWYADALHNLADVYMMMGDYSRVEDLYKRALKIRQESLGEDHPDVAASLGRLGELYHTTGNYAVAKQLLERALEIYRGSLGEKSYILADILSALAELYRQMGDYGLAEKCFEQALEIRRKSLGEEHPDVAKSFRNLALLYRTTGDYSRAEDLYKRALEIYRRSPNEDHPKVATSLHNLGVLYNVMGNYAEAESRLKQALEIRRKSLGEDHSDVAIILHALANLYREIGNYARARMLFEQAVEIHRNSLGEEHPDFATTLNGLAALYETMGDYSRAKPLFEQVREIALKSYGEEHRAYASVLGNLSQSYLGMHNYDQAEEFAKKALEITRRIFGQDHIETAVPSYNLAFIYHLRGAYADAEPLYKQGLEISRRSLGKDHPSVANNLRSLAILYAATDRETEALKLVQEALVIQDQMIGQVFSISSDRQRMAYLTTLRSSLDTFLSLTGLRSPQSSAAAQAAIRLVLRRKGLGAEALSAQLESILSGRYPDLEPQLRELATLRMQIARKTLDGPGEESLSTYRHLLTEWSDQQDRIEDELARQIPEMALERQMRKVDQEAVARELPRDSTLIEVVRFTPLDFRARPAQGGAIWKPARYLAFVLPAGKADIVRMVDLGEAEPIDQLIADFRNSITYEEEGRSLEDTESPAETADLVFERDPAVVRKSIGDAMRNLGDVRGLVPDYVNLGYETLYGDEGARLRAAVFDKLVPYLGGYTRLFLAPDGDLSRLPFEALPTGDGRYLIDEYQISYLSTGRDVLRFATDSAVEPTLPFVVADPDFDRGSTSVSTPSWKVVFKRLSGTRKEGQRIAQMLGVTPLLGHDSLEAIVKNTRSPRLLHIATHGFFQSDTPRGPNEEVHEVGTMSGLDGGLLGRLANVENPLLRSGLALVGANTWLNGGSLPADAGDGLLMAEDVTGMDLLATELVVLSACQTGLGEVHSGEGVYGLRRAFVVAGAKTLVMSLWKVPDKQTQQLMEDFYRRLLQREGEPRAEALRQAQLAMKKDYPDPLCWAAFICQGDPGPLRRR